MQEALAKVKEEEERLRREEEEKERKREEALKAKLEKVTLMLVVKKKIKTFLSQNRSILIIKRLKDLNDCKCNFESPKLFALHTEEA